MLRPLGALLAIAIGGCSLRGIADGIRDGGPGITEAGVDGGSPDGAGADGGCTAATCKPIPLVTGEVAGSLATNGTTVAWATSRHVATCATKGCDAARNLTSDHDLTGFMALEGETLWYTTGPTANHGVEICSLPDCADDRALAYDIGAPRAVAVDQGNAYVLEVDGKRILHCVTGCDDIASGITPTGAVAVSAASVFFSTSGADGAVYTCLRTGCAGAPTPLASAQANPRALAVDRGAVYWTTYDDGTVMSCALGGCAGGATELARAQGNPLGIASDGERVYWANEGVGTVVSCDVRGCGGAPTVLAKDLDRPQWVAVDAHDVYFSTAAGTIFRLPK